MKRDINKFYRKKENGGLELLENYLVSFSFRRGLYTDMERCPMVNCYINKDKHFELFLVWYKFPVKEFIESHVTGNLPKVLDTSIEELFAYSSLQLKDSYTDSDDIYVADDIQHEWLTINHGNESHSVQFSPYYFREKLIETDQEKLILKLYWEIDQWVTQQFSKVKASHE